MSEKRSVAGTVAVEDFRGRLRLRWRYKGKQYTVSLGIPVSTINHKTAAIKARQIELDIASGHYDDSLKSYHPARDTHQDTQTSSDLFKEFIIFKGKTISPRSLEKYQATLNYICKYFGTTVVTAIDINRVDKFILWLAQQGLSPVVQKERLTLISAAWTWAVKQKRLDANPWLDAPKRVKVPPKQPPKPFTREEIATIIQAFKNDQYYCHYADYVAFLFGTGCRTSEAIGLRWGHLTEDCSSVWIGESLTRSGKGVVGRLRKATKTNRARHVSLSASLTQMLQTRRPIDVDPDALVFTTKRGLAIDDANFRERAWKTILTRLEIDYRKPYTTRHTLISHALDQGMSPVTVAQLTGHDVQTLYQNYAGNVNSRPQLPEL